MPVAPRSPARRPRASLIETLESRQHLTTVPAGFIDSSFGPSISNGTAMAFAPDGRLFVLQQTGQVNILNVDGSAATATPALSLSTTSYSERGLLGLAFDPAFATNGYLYLYYTELPAGQTSTQYSGQTHNRVSRFTVTGNTIDSASETLVVELDAVNAGNHNGGALGFGPDGKLYVAVGENAVSSNAQSLTTRLGKILRYNSDGTIPADNPTTIAGLGATSGVNRAIWAAGVRNPYTFTFNSSGTMYINDVGQDTWEEIDIGGAGRNFGWPTTEGDFTQTTYPNFTRPLYYYHHGAGNQMGYAITGGAYYNSTAATAFPTSYSGKYFFGDYVNNWIGVLDPANPSAVSSAPNFASNANGPVNLQIGPDGSLYYLHRSGSPSGVSRIVADHPTSTAATFSRERIAAGRPPQELLFNFNHPVTASASSLQLVNLTTGQTIPGANLSVVVDSASNQLRFDFTGVTGTSGPDVLPDGNYRATLTAAGVTDAAGLSPTQNIVVTFRVLAGDANNNGTVDFDDLLTLAQNYNTAGHTFAQGNFDYSTDGLVSFDDLLILAQRYNTSLLAAPAIAAKATTAKKRPATGGLEI